MSRTKVVEIRERLDSLKAKQRAAEKELEQAVEEALCARERGCILETLHSKEGRKWHLVEGMSRDDEHFFMRKGDDESYLTDLQGHRIKRRHSYEGWAIKNDDAWNVAAIFCRSRQHAVDCADTELDRVASWRR